MKLYLGRNTHVYVTLVGMMLIFFAQPYKLSQFASLGTTVITMATLLSLFEIFFLRGIRRQEKGVLNEDLLLLFLIFAVVFVYIFAGQYSYSKMIPMVCFLEAPILMNSVSHSTRKIRNIVFWVFYLLSVYCIILSRTSVAYQYFGEYGITTIEELTLGLPNPNQTAMYLMIVFFVLCIAAVEQKRIITKGLFAANAIGIAYLIYCTKSRSALVITLLFGLYILPIFRAKFSGILRRIALVFPALFAVILIVYRDSLASFMFMGDAFDTGRVNIFIRALESLDVSTFLLGNYREYASHNLHNIFVSVLVEYGVVVAILFGRFIWLAGNSKNVEDRNASSVLAVVGFALVMVFSSTEAAFYIGGSLYAGFVFVLHYLSLPLEPSEV